jgi:hypothetical protein
MQIRHVPKNMIIKLEQHQAKWVRPGPSDFPDSLIHSYKLAND